MDESSRHDTDHQQFGRRVLYPGSPRALDAAVIRAALTRVMLVAHFDLAVRGRDDGWLRAHQCPACAKRWAELAGSGFCIGARGWVCKACGARGDLLDLLARLAGLDPRRDFPTVLALAAELTGLDQPRSPAARATHLAALARTQQACRRLEAAAEQRRREAARDAAPRAWAALRREHPRGRRYLEGRGLNVEALVARDLVRFAPDGWLRTELGGDPTVALHDWDGAPLNIVRRRVGAGAPRTPGLRGHPTDGTIAGHLRQIVGPIDVVLTEGVIDTLNAALAWPHAVVLGAHGVNNLARICAAAAPRVRAAGGRLLLVPDTDAVGQDAAVAAGTHALDAGFVIDRDLLVIDVRPAPDLNAAWCAGWRP